MPHTVQIYSLRDRAPTYGNEDFSDLLNWTAFLMKAGRPVVFYPETAYWVNYDISVPIFLAPVYASSRVEDALLLDEISSPSRPMGQLNFESGWEWGYWLANSAQAAVAWRRFENVTAVFAHLFRFLERPYRDALVALLDDFAVAQRRLLIGGLPGTPPAPRTKSGTVTGIAYIMGSEGLSDIASLVIGRFSHHGTPQPDRLHFSDLWYESRLSVFLVLLNGFGRFGKVASDIAGFFYTTFFTLRSDRARWYDLHLRPLLAEMNSTFSELADRFDALPAAPPQAEEYARDLRVSARLLALRCAQVAALYAHAARCGGRAADEPDCADLLAAARRSLEEALALVPEREAQYGLAAKAGKQIYGWRPPNPTAYHYGYLWAAHRLFYWQRDQAIVEHRVKNPCFGTINSAVQLGLQGGGRRFVHQLRELLERALDNRLWAFGLAECLDVPEREPSPLEDAAEGGAEGWLFSSLVVALSYLYMKRRGHDSHRLTTLLGLRRGDGGGGPPPDVPAARVAGALHRVRTALGDGRSATPTGGPPAAAAAA
ncbi:unnamed protein product, partial [Prorocentrum cordatum]